jgi:hypothetical protein
VCGRRFGAIVVRAIFVPADDRQRVSPFDAGRPEDLSALVGDMTEGVDLVKLGITVYVDESGLVKRLPFNSRATFLWWHDRQTAGDAILVGNAVIVGLWDDDGNDTDVPAETMRLLTESRRLMAEVRSGTGPWQRPSDERGSYWDALVWSIVLLQTWPAATHTRIVEA